MDLKQLRASYFPRLSKKNCRFTSPESPQYNCIAWAAGVDDIWWEPDQGYMYFWPLSAERTYTLSAYVQAFGTKGFLPCNSAKIEAGVQKVALYAKNNFPKHAAKQLPDGWWASKLGRDVDIEHTLVALNGGVYGDVVIFLKKPVVP